MSASRKTNKHPHYTCKAGIKSKVKVLLRRESRMVSHKMADDGSVAKTNGNPRYIFS